MNSPRHPLRRVGLLGVALLLVAVATSCNGSSVGSTPPAATVDGTDITRAQLEKMVNAQIAYVEESTKIAKKAAKAKPSDSSLATAAQQAVEAQKTFDQRYRGSGPDSLGLAGTSDVLNSLIQIEVSRAALEAVGGKVTPEEAAAVRTSVEEQLTQQGIKSTKPFKALLDAEVERKAILDALTKHYTKAGEWEALQRKVYEQEVGSQTQLCVNIMDTADEASAQAALARINGGEDFLTVATEVSAAGADQNPTLKEGGEQCVAKASLANVFGDAVNTAGVGSVLGPADGQGSWLTARVVSTKVPTFEESQAQIAQAVPDPAVTRAENAIKRQLKKMHVTVDPRLGTWNKKLNIVEPPFDPQATTTTTTAPVGSAPTASAGG